MANEKGTRRWCFVPCCSSSTANTPQKLFVCVPFDLKMRRKWAAAARRDDAKTLTSRNPWYCCEDHFEPEADFANYMKQKLMGGKVYMKKGIIPHKFACQQGRNRHRLQRSSYERRQLKEIADQAVMEYEDETVCEGEEAVGDQGAEEGTLELEMATGSQSTQTEILVASQASQTDPHEGMKGLTGADIRPEHGGREAAANSEDNMSDSETESEYREKENVSDTDYNPSSSEAESEEEEEEIDYLSLHRTRTMCKKFPKRYIGVPPESLWVIERLAHEVIEPLYGSVAKLCPYDVCLLVLMKIKQDRQFAYLGDDFGISRGHAGRIFAKYVDVIAEAMSDFIFWPTEAAIKKSLPLAFKARYCRVTCIIDCLEIEIEKPSAAVNQSLTWSAYKSCNTLKYLVSITPNGLVNFVSEGFGGRASDMAVLKRSSFLTCLKPGMVVMADRGFKALESLLVDRGCSLVRPVSVAANAVLERDQVLLSKQVASLRIHVERAIRRVREFAMLRPHAVVDAKLSDYADSCMIIACGLVNTQLPLTKV